MYSLSLEYEVYDGDRINVAASRFYTDNDVIFVLTRGPNVPGWEESPPPKPSSHQPNFLHWLAAAFHLIVNISSLIISIVTPRSWLHSNLYQTLQENHS